VGRTADEFDLAHTAEAIALALPRAVPAGVLGHPGEILAILDEHRPDVVFNLCEAPLGRPHLEAHVAALLEWRGIRFTGAGSYTLALCRRKDATRAILAAAGIPVPHLDAWPCIVKPVDDDGSSGVSELSVCHTAVERARAVAALPGEALAEEFLPGREFAVALWGAREPAHVSIGETLFKAGLRVNTYRAKWDPRSDDFANSPLSYQVELSPELHAAVVTTARQVWAAVKARSYLRLDLRLSMEGIPKVLDVNPNPEMGEGVGMCRAVTEAGWAWATFLERVVAWA
jgi:D-alanine-D-alanine ligase